MKGKLTAKGRAAIRRGIKARWAKWRAAKKAAPSNGHPDLDTMRQNGIKYLASRREVLLAQVDAIDAALKTMS